MANAGASAAAVEVPPSQEGGSGDPLPDSNAASGNHQAEAVDAGVEAGEPVESNFILDTAVPVHATGDVRLITDARALGPGDTASMTRRDGVSLQATLVGNVEQGTIFCLPNVHYFNGLPAASTLVSVQQLSRHGFSVTFGGPTCIVRDGNTGAVVGEGQLRADDGFYHLDFLMVPMN